MWPFIGEPSGTCAGSMERSHDIRSRARETRMAAMTGRATSNKPSRMTSRWPAAIATSTTMMPITTKNRPRWVSSRHGRDTMCYLRSGMCTEEMAWAMTSLTVRRASWASVDGSTRWASTDTPRAATSSGVT